MMSTELVQDLETIYDSYCSDAASLQADRLRVSRPYRLGGGALAFVLGVIPMIASMLGKLPPGAFWAGAIVAVLIMGITLVLASNAEKRVIAEAAQSRPGFAQFYKLFLRRNYWPYKMVTGEKLDKFLAIIGRKSP
jgi:hypothetical protein